MKNVQVHLTFLLILLFPFSLTAQDHAQALKAALDENPRAADTLLSYSSDVQHLILEASLYPDTLQEMGKRQQQSRTQFQKLLSPYPRKTQEKVYNLVRYPELFENLVQGGPKSKGAIEDLVQGYPESIKKDALDLGRKEYSLLANIQSVQTRSNQEFDRLIADLPASSQRAFRNLLSYPEILETLGENRDLTLALGEAYRSSPSETQSLLTARSESLANQKEDALADYRETLRKDPQARKELQKSAKAYAAQSGYPDDYYEEPPPSSQSVSTVVNININPYPYWFGYPYWYSYSFWRPYPLWYQTGVYFGLGGAAVIWGWPSYGYSSWFYAYPRNFVRYPYLSSYYGNYYNRWRRTPIYSGFYRGARQWHYQNRHAIHRDLWRYDRHRAERWRDFGHRQVERRGRHGSHHPGWHPAKGEKPGDHRYWGKNRHDKKPGDYRTWDKQRHVKKPGYHRGWDKNPHDKKPRVGKGPKDKPRWERRVSHNKGKPDRRNGRKDRWKEKPGESKEKWRQKGPVAKGPGKKEYPPPGQAPKGKRPSNNNRIPKPENSRPEKIAHKPEEKIQGPREIPTQARENSSNKETPYSWGRSTSASRSSSSSMGSRSSSSHRSIGRSSSRGGSFGRRR